MLYREEQRDLFGVNEGRTNENAYCLAHCISADFGMFGGIVVEFNRRWDMKNRLLQKYGSQEKNFTENAMVYPEEVRHLGLDITVYNLVTKLNVHSVPTYMSLSNSLELLRKHMIINHKKYLAIPKIGCGIDGLNWNIVRGIIQDVFVNTEIEILVCYVR